MKRRNGMLVAALAYSGALACGAIWALSRPAQTHGERFWRSAEQVSLLERSYVRCVRSRYKAAGLPLSAELESSMLLHQRDLWGQALQDPDLTAAPLERIGRRSFIRCAWFSDAGPATVACSPRRGRGVPSGPGDRRAS